MIRAFPSLIKTTPACIAASLAFAAAAHADWAKPEWKSRAPVTLDAALGAGAPVLIRLHSGNFDFAACKEDASDLRFVTEDGKTELPHHIERHDAMLGEAFVWVKAPAAGKPGEPVRIHAYYGNPAATAPASKGVFDDATALAWHFAERDAAPADWTGSGNAGESPCPLAEGAIIGSAAKFDGIRHVALPASPSLEFKDNAPLTLSLWFKSARERDNAVIYSRRAGADALVIGLAKGEPYVEITRAGAVTRSAPVAVAPTGKWHHLATVSDAGATTLYLNGAPIAKAAAGIPAIKAAARLGNDTGPKSSGFIGEIDEFTVANAARPADAIRIAALNQGPDGAATASPGQAEVNSAAGGEDHAGYFKVIVDSLTFDGWVVIGLLSVMAVASWLLMVTKVAYLNSGAKGNKLFMAGWAKLARNLHAIDNGDHSKVESVGGNIDAADRKTVKNSPIYRIFDVGAEEIRHRIRAEGSSKVLTAESIEAIRARLDGAMVRETQKLDRLMVILTISISGGPFLGLLGTVVGVMITFAAVAMAGDVNVNAIAPGISAALLATVAGLAVAIPALFAYNYILGRIKDIKADIQVFIDEFITSMAEFYQPGAAEASPRHEISAHAALIELAARLDAYVKVNQAALETLGARLDNRLKSDAILRVHAAQLGDDE